MIDQFYVVRLKGGIPHGGDAALWGTRTDVLVCRPSMAQKGIECWPYKPKLVDGWKESHGLAAARLIVEKLNPQRLHIIGCDRLMGRFNSGKFNGKPFPEHAPHNWQAEREALRNLGVAIVELCPTL